MKQSMLALLVGLLLTGLVVSAQSSALQRTDPYVNDLAGVLPAASENRIRTWLTELQRDHQIEMTVLTIDSVSDYAEPFTRIELFATRLFNRWRIGTLPDNRGMLLLMAVDDREIRLELGAGYDRTYNIRAETIMDEFILPRFRREDYDGGLELGVRAAYHMATGEWPTGAEMSVFEQAGNFLSGINPTALLIGLGALVAAVGGLFWYRESRRCPQCGQIALEIHGSVLESATRYSEGLKHVHKYCPLCQYETTEAHTIARISDSDDSDSSSGSSGSSGGGGYSSGGGATSRW